MELTYSLFAQAWMDNEISKHPYLKLYFDSFEEQLRRNPSCGKIVGHVPADVAICPIRQIVKSLEIYPQMIANSNRLLIAQFITNGTDVMIIKFKYAC